MPSIEEEENGRSLHSCVSLSFTMKSGSGKKDRGRDSPGRQRYATENELFRAEACFGTGPLAAPAFEGCSFIECPSWPVWRYRIGTAASRDLTSKNQRLSAVRQTVPLSHPL